MPVLIGQSLWHQMTVTSESPPIDGWKEIAADKVREIDDKRELAECCIIFTPDNCHNNPRPITVLLSLHYNCC